MIPGALRRAAEAHLGPVLSASPVGGGCISNGLRAETARGPLFLTYNPQAPPGMFAAEAAALERLSQAADALVVPRVLAHAEADGVVPAWIAMEWLEPAPRSPEFMERLGRGLARMHRVEGSGAWGWERDNFIGSLPQQNAPASSWTEFWRERRIHPQLDLARRSGRLPGREADWDRLLDRLPEILAPRTRTAPPSFTATCGAATCSPRRAAPRSSTRRRTSDTARWTLRWRTSSAASVSGSTRRTAMPGPRSRATTSADPCISCTTCSST